MAFNLDDLKRHSVIDERECWIWQRAKTSAGYGVICGDASRFYTHRVAAELTLGPCPEGKEVMHSCDVRACCNPDHLSYGTRAENVADMWERGRARPGHTYGEEHHGAKLTAEKAIEIRDRRSAGELLRVLAADYGVSIPAISAVVTGRTWTHGL